MTHYPVELRNTSPLNWPRSFAKAIGAAFSRWRAKRRRRIELRRMMELDDAVLLDVGLTRRAIMESGQLPLDTPERPERLLGRALERKPRH